MKHKTLQKLFRYKLQWLVLLTALLGMSQGVWAWDNLTIEGTWDNTKHDIKGTDYPVYLEVGNYCFRLHTTNDNGKYFGNTVDITNSGTWAFYASTTSGGRCNNNGSAYLQVTTAGTFTFRSDDYSDAEPSVTVTYPPVPVSYKIAGDGGLTGTTWSTDCSGGSCVLSINPDDPDYSEIPSITFQNQTSGTKRFKIVTCGTWDGAANCKTSHTCSFVDGDSWADCDGVNNIGLTLGGTRDVTIAYNGSCVYIRTEVPCTPPTASDFAVSSGATPTYDGSSHQAVVVGSVGSPSTYNPTNVVCYYGANSSTTATSQTNAGTYNIYVHSADADGDYCAVTSTITTALATQLVISPVTPSLSNYSDLFSITGTGSHAYTGVAQSVAVAWKSPYTGCKGAITVKYNNSTDAPTNVGTYPITISVAAGTNNNASASDISVGTLTITAISPGLALGDISNKCGTGDYALSSTSNSAGAVTYSVTSGNAEIVNGTTLRVNATGDVTVKASQVANGNYTAQEVSKTFTFAAAPVAGFSASAESSTLNFSNAADVSTTLNTAANSNWDFQWVCDSHPTWGTNNTPTIVSSTSNSTEVRFPIEGVYTFHVGARCKNKNDDSYVNSTTVTVTVSLPLCIKGPLTASDGDWHSYSLISNISDSNTRTYSFTAFNKGSNIREFVLDASPSGDGDNHHIHTSSTVGNLTLTGLDYNSGNHYNLRALESLGISESGTRVVLTITHNGGYYYNLSLALDCTTPEAKTISISASSVCEGESANVIVGSSQSGYIYTVYDSNSGVAGSGTGTGSDLNISVTPSSNTTYTVKAKQGSTCSETAMRTTVDVAVSPRPKYSPASGITQYLPVTVTSDASSPSWTFNKESGSLDGAWLSNTSGASTVFKAPTGSYTVSDGTCATGLITVSDDTETCD